MNDWPLTMVSALMRQIVEGIKSVGLEDYAELFAASHINGVHLGSHEALREVVERMSMSSSDAAKLTAWVEKTKAGVPAAFYILSDANRAVYEN
eukprot:SAG31_NODE_2323_length_5941_cov_3.155255_3_plen_94_part_00